MKRLWLLFAGLLLFQAEASMFAQSAEEETISEMEDTLPLAVDGALTPDRIPEELAWQHFILAIALPDDPSSADVSRRNSMLARVGLSEEDQDNIVGALTGVRPELEAIDQGSAPYVFVELLAVERKSIMDKARDRILTAVTSEARLKIEEHIREHVKPRIRIYGVAPW